MKEWALDLHVHTVLSPCAAPEMLPANVLGQARAVGIEVLAITDHNTAENVPAFVAQGRELGVHVLPGMEVQTREDVHLVCLFEQIHQVLKLQALVYDKLPQMKNRKEIYGEQWVLDQAGRKIKELERLLLVGISLSIEETVQAVHRLGGLCLAAHIDRPAFSLWGHLGGLPPGLPLDGVELTPHLPRCPQQMAQLAQANLPYLVSSDAHYLADLKGPYSLATLREVSLSELKLALKGQAGRHLRVCRKE